MESEQNVPGQQPAAPEGFTNPDNDIERPRIVDAGALLDAAWRHYRFSFRSFAPISLALLGVVILQQIGVASTSIIVNSIAVIAGVVLMLFGYLAMLYTIARDVHEPLAPGDAYRMASEAIGPYILVVILSTLAMLGGVPLLIVPALIIYILVVFAPLTFALEGKRGMSALVQSWHYVKSRWWSVAIRLVVYLVVIAILYVGVSFAYLIAKIPVIGIGNVLRVGTPSPDEAILMNIFDVFFLVPFSIAFMYVLYNSVRSAQTELLTEEREKSIRKKLSIFIGIGLALVILGSAYKSYMVMKNPAADSPVLQNASELFRR